MANEKKAAWTPGPWHCFDGGLNGFAVADSSKGTPRLAHVGYREMTNGRCEGYEQAKADAKLIAKAPEMAETLKTVLHLAYAHGFNSVVIKQIESVLREAGALTEDRS